MAAWKWYVYELVAPNGEVFYVGKGSGDRMHQHEVEAKDGKVSHKCNKIRSIWADGGKVEKRQVAFFCDEQQAYIHEANRIAEYGLESLTNKVLATTLVSDKRLLADSGKRAYEIIKGCLEHHFASWLKLTNAGQRKVQINSELLFTKEATEQFYNDFAPKIFWMAMQSKKYAFKVKDLMQKHGVQLQFVRADDYGLV